MWQQTKFVSHSYKNVEKIFPLKQHTVEELIEHCKAHYPSITRIVIFGSSVTPACNPWSDLDVYLEGIGRSEGFVQKGTRQGIRPRRPATGLPWVLADRSSRAGNKVGPAPCNSPPLGICIPGAAPRGNCVALMPCGA